MPSELPPRPDLKWLKKLCAQRLSDLRQAEPEARLSAVQLDVARQYGFASWRKLKAHIDLIRDRLATEVPTVISPDDRDLGRLLAAVREGRSTDVVQMLEERPALVSAHGPEGQTALHVAAQRNDPGMTALLTTHGADPDAGFGESGHTPMSWAVTCGSERVVSTLASLGHEPDLFCAAGSGLVDVVRGHFDADGKLREGAARTGSSRVGPDGRRLPCPPETPSEQITDALYIACRNAHTEVVRVLLAHQPDLSFRAYCGATPLHWAYFSGSQEVIRLVLEAGADPTLTDDVLGCTPRAFGVCTAANWGFADQVRICLREDRSLAMVADGATSPLHEAARSGDPETVKVLLDAGADPAAKNAQEQTPVDIANASGNTEVVALLSN